MSERKTSEWTALHKVWERKKQIIIDREKEHAQHVIDHGAPRTRPETWLAALVLMKANRIWNNLVRGGTADALVDSVLDLSNYADFLAALLDEQKNGEFGEKKEFPWVGIKYVPHTIPNTTGAPASTQPYLPFPSSPDRCFTCGEPLQPGSILFGDVHGNGPFYCGAHAPVCHK